MLRNTTLRAIIAVALVFVTFQALGRLLLSISWLTTISLTIAWTAAIAVGVAVFIGLGRPGRSRQGA